MNSYQELSAEQLVRKLEFAGEFPPPDLIDAIWEREKETRPLLCQLFREAAHDDWEKIDDLRLYRFVHAGKFMLAWQDEAALPEFAEMYMEERLQDWCEWFEEDPANYGPVAIPHFARVVQMDSGRRWHYGRALSGSILLRIAKGYPENREEIASILRAQLPSLDVIPTLTTEEYDEVWSSFTIELTELADEASREQIMALFDADMIDSSFMRQQNYLQDMNRGFKPEKPKPPYHIRQDYREKYESEQRRLKQLAAEQKREREQRIQQAQPRIEPKIGRNDPCPCGSGKKYKHCHGRPGAQAQIN